MRKELKNNKKILSVVTDDSDKEMISKVSKIFSYTANRITKINSIKQKDTEINIKKVRKTKENIEKFQLNIRGNFYVSKNTDIFSINFLHSLNIKIKWK